MDPVLPTGEFRMDLLVFLGGSVLAVAAGFLSVI